MFDWLIVGAGFAGSVLAERLATQRNEKVLLIDRRAHIGGNAYDEYDAAGLLVHRYGPHIFHTNSQQILDYLSQFTAWRAYEHRVRGVVDGKRVPIPINRTTVNTLYGLDLDEAGVAAFLAGKAEPVDPIRSSEDVVVSQVGRELYEAFFRGYTRKQWGLDPAQLDKSVTARVPVRSNDDDRYFTDTHQCMPAQGYTRLFERMLAHQNIKVMLKTDLREIADVIPFRRMIFTGPIDEYFGHRFGKLPYRSLSFEHVTRDQDWFQEVGTVNFPQSEAYTRITEFKHLTGQEHPKTSLVYEYPQATGEPYYPVPTAESQALYKRYEELARSTANVWFVGRLATYRYYNMDQVVGQALATFRRINEEVPMSARKQLDLKRRSAFRYAEALFDDLAPIALAPGARGNDRTETADRGKG